VVTAKKAHFALGQALASRTWAKAPRRWLRGMRRRSYQLQMIWWGRGLWYSMRMRANEGVCSVEFETKTVGFFAQMNWCLFIFQYCETHGLVPYIRLTGENYLDRRKAPNWLEYYFEASEPWAVST
jgi:hypothetical protein